ncbi:hypothetical protein CE143_20025 [Photorhabdus luminescens]|uniref:Uncharacterized protein n=1 Tax=Photorhabdus akhurstii TaxID=171438 RepID=A0ABX8M3G7_9GAMM|nr:hypothetical protein B0X70_19980 [Photorhabdus akhurstii]UJD77032.1 hypothetical protein CE143_20025 [Photorhabdus luminescens]
MNMYLYIYKSKDSPLLDIEIIPLGYTFEKWSRMSKKEQNDVISKYIFNNQSYHYFIKAE